MMFYLHNEQPFIMRMNALLLHVTAQLNLTNIMLIKIKPDTKEFLLSDFIYIKLKYRQN